MSLVTILRSLCYDSFLFQKMYYKLVLVELSTQSRNLRVVASFNTDNNRLGRVIPASVMTSPVLSRTLMHWDAGAVQPLKPMYSFGIIVKRKYLMRFVNRVS